MTALCAAFQLVSIRDYIRDCLAAHRALLNPDDVIGIFFLSPHFEEDLTSSGK